LKNKAYWITHKASYAASVSGLFHYKRLFRVETLPDHVFIRLGADQEYKLYVNGHLVGHGPVRSDLKHSFYDRRNIRSFLETGENCLHVEVLYLPDVAAASVQTAGLACFVEFEHPAFREVNSNRFWQVSKDPGTEFLTSDTQFFPHVIPAGPREKIHAAEKRDALDVARQKDGLQWIAASPLKEIRYHKKGQTPRIWDLNPRQLDFSIEDEGNELELLDRKQDPQGDRDNEFPMVVPAGRCEAFLFRYPSVCTAFVDFQFHGGKDAKVRIIYNESMYESAKPGEVPVKVERNTYKGKELYGLYDEVLLDGGHVKYRPFHYRCFRYLKIEIQTAGEDCLIFRPRVWETHFPFPNRARFHSSDKELEHIFEASWRTLENSCHDTFVDCPYYERLQYFGDINVSYPLSLYLGGRHELLKQALEQAFFSMAEEELSACAFPASTHKVIPFFNLCLINLLYKYSFHTGDTEFARSHLPRVSSILDWYDGRLGNNGTLGPLPYWNFVDCPPAWPWSLEKGTVGDPPGADDGDSSILNFQYLYGLKSAISLLGFLGEGHQVLANRYRVLRQKCIQAYWDDTAAYFSDTTKEGRFSQHAGIFALLADAVPAEYKRSVLHKILHDNRLIQASVHVLGYLHALIPGIDPTIAYRDLLGPWKSLVRMGFTTFPEYPSLQSRSDCHPWSAFPGWEILRQICGFEWIAPGQKRLQLRPRPSGLDDFKGSFPSRFGTVELSYEKTPHTANEAEVRFGLKVPAGLEINWSYGKENLICTEGVYQLSYIINTT